MFPLPWKTVLVVAGIALLWQYIISVNTKEWQDSTDPEVAAISAAFQASIIADNDTSDTTQSQSQYKIKNRGTFQWDLATFVWDRFADKFGSNFNAPYMYSVFPLTVLGGLPSPMWPLRHHEAVVLLAKEPPPVEYFSITTQCLWTWKRGLFFSSLGDTVNVHNIHDRKKEATSSIFAHVVVTQTSQSTLRRVQDALIQSGVPKEAIHVAVVPSELIDEDTGAVFEVVMRLFGFEDESQGEAYLQSNHPVFHIQAGKSDKNTGATELLPMPTYKERSHPDHVNEPLLYAEDFATFQDNVVENLRLNFHSSNDDGQNDNSLTVQQVPFAPLDIRGLHCLKNKTHCLGDCPDAAYYGSNIGEAEEIQSLKLSLPDEFHVITMIDHRHTNAATYSSMALMKSPSAILKKSRIDIRATPVGVLSNREFRDDNQKKSDDKGAVFFSWIFTRNPDHCEAIMDNSDNEIIDGCTVVSDQDVKLNAYMAYCERLYMNPITGTGPDWDRILPAQLYHVQNIPQQRKDMSGTQSLEQRQQNAALFAKIRLPSSEVPLKVFQGEERLRWMHIVKTGGVSFQEYLRSSPDMVPQVDYGTCRQTSMTNLTGTKATAAAAKSTSCKAITTFISTLLCGLSCECCATDMYEEGRFHGTFLRSPRAHTLSLFTHGHNAHHTTWSRMVSDIENFLAEFVLRGSEHLCGHSGTGGVPDWGQALKDNLKASLESWSLSSSNDASSNQGPGGVQVISLRNFQSHALVCNKATRGSLGQHFHVLPPHVASETSDRREQSVAAVDLLEPDIDEALKSLNRMEWVGITDLFHPSLCLLHFQANQTVPRACDCRHEDHYTKNAASKPLGYWVEYRNKRVKTADLSPDVLELIDAHTTLDSQIFSTALRLFLGRLRQVGEKSGTSILECIDWQALQKKTDYIPGLWSGPDSLLVAGEREEPDSPLMAEENE